MWLTTASMMTLNIRGSHININRREDSPTYITPTPLQVLTMLMNCCLLPDLEESSLYETGWYLVHHWPPWGTLLP